MSKRSNGWAARESRRASPSPPSLRRVATARKPSDGTHASSSEPPTGCLRAWGSELSPDVRSASFGRPASMCASTRSRPGTSSLPRKPRSRASPATGYPIQRSARDCSSAGTPSTITSARYSQSWGSPRANQLARALPDSADAGHAGYNGQADMNGHGHRSPAHPREPTPPAMTQRRVDG